MLQPSEYLKIVNNAIEHIDLPSCLPGLYDPIRYAMAAGGKRLRPVLLLAVNDAFGGDIDQALWPAVGIEMFHNFTLVHDDVMDNADVRRGRPAVHKKWDVNTAILSGDAMTTIAYKCMSCCQPQYLPEVIDKFSQMTMAVYEGQQIDSDFERRDKVTMHEYLRMVMGKTSALIAYPCAIGATLAGADPEEAQRMFNYGISLGIAFQMQDDYLDVYGDPATFGKEIGGDIANDKKTWLHIIAADHDPEGEFAALCGSDLPRAEKVARVTEFYDKLDLRRQGQKLINRYTDDALAELEATSMTKEAKQWFADFAHRLVGRDK